MSDIVDWTALPNTLFVVSAKTSDGIVHDVAMCSVPHALRPEVAYVRADNITALRAEAERLRAALEEVKALYLGQVDFGKPRTQTEDEMGKVLHEIWVTVRAALNTQEQT